MTADAASPPPPEAASAAAALAGLRDGGRAPTAPNRRPFRIKLDTGLSIEVPGPAVIADGWAASHLAASFDVFAVGAAILTRPAGSDVTPAPTPLSALVDALRDGIATLPERHDAGRPYKDLRLLVSEAETATVNGYLAEVVRAVRRNASPLPKPDQPPRPELTPEQRERNYRASQRRYARNTRREARDTEEADHELTAAWLLKTQEDTTPGTVIAPKSLKAKCDQVFSAADREPVGRNKFLKIADEAVGPRVRRRVDGRPQPAYVTREVHPMTREERKDIARLIVAKIADDWKADALAGMSDLVSESSGLAAAVDDATRGADVLPFRRAV